MEIKMTHIYDEAKYAEIVNNTNVITYLPSEEEIREYADEIRKEAEVEYELSSHDGISFNMAVTLKSDKLAFYGGYTGCATCGDGEWIHHLRVFDNKQEFLQFLKDGDIDEDKVYFRDSKEEEIPLHAVLNGLIVMFYCDEFYIFYNDNNSCALETQIISGEWGWDMPEFTWDGIHYELNTSNQTLKVLPYKEHKMEKIREEINDSERILNRLVEELGREDEFFWNLASNNRRKKYDYDEVVQIVKKEHNERIQFYKRIIEKDNILLSEIQDKYI